MSTFEHEHTYRDDRALTDAGPRWAPCPCGAVPTICQACGDPCPTSVPIHDACLQAERQVLDDVDALVRAWPEPVREILTATSYDLTGITTTDDAARLPFGLDTVTDDPAHGAQGIRTTWGALDVLGEWRTLWVEAGAGPIGDDGVTGYLRSRLVWAATNPGRSDLERYRREARTVRARLRHLHGDGTEPVEGARCLTCGGQLAHVRAVGILDDQATCTRCGLAYDVAGIGRARRARIATAPAVAPDALVTEPEARRVFAEVGGSTIRSWIKRGQLAPAGSRYGSATYRVADIAALARPDAAAGGRIGA